MKLVTYLLGIILIVVAAMYFLLPADSLPGFFPGHETGLARMRYKHGMVSGVVGVVLLAVGWFMGGGERGDGHRRIIFGYRSPTLRY